MKHEVNLDECHLFALTIMNGDYGNIAGKCAHRVVYESEVGEIPVGFEIDHLCRVRRCINTDHLEVVTHQENMKRRSFSYVPIEFCQRGHKFTEDNVYRYLRPSGVPYRQCKACKKLRDASRAPRKLRQIS